MEPPGSSERFSLSILIITHNLNVVRHITDRIAIMYLGRFVEHGHTDDVFDAPRHPYTAALLSANPSPDPAVRKARIAISGEVSSLMDRPSGCEFHTRCARADAICRQNPPERTAASDRRVYTCHYPLNMSDADSVKSHSEN